jgi:hypothetical protein
MGEGLAPLAGPKRVRRARFLRRRNTNSPRIWVLALIALHPAIFLHHPCKNAQNVSSLSKLTLLAVLPASALAARKLTGAFGPARSPAKSPFDSRCRRPPTVFPPTNRCESLERPRAPNRTRRPKPQNWLAVRDSAASASRAARIRLFPAAAYRPYRKGRRPPGNSSLGRPMTALQPITAHRESGGFLKKFSAFESTESPCQP